ncbi:MAG: hypothetical protein IJU70_00150 [Lentisphaeria bacterium]|nr:hypothetical protein [Lentisphaeria bacterium]
MQIRKTVALSDRAAEIYSILREETLLLPPGAALPPIRRIQKRFHVGQATASQAHHALAESFGTASSARKKLRKPAATAVRHKLRDCVLIICSQCLDYWLPVIDAWNRVSRSAVVPYPVDDLAACVSAAQEGKGDFVLFPTNPFMYGVVENSLPWVNLAQLAVGIDRKAFYPAAFLTDPDGRFWGIAPALNVMVLAGYSDLIDLRGEHLDWQFLAPRWETVKREHPELEYAFVLDGYVTFLFDHGIEMTDGITGRLRFDPDSFREPLFYLKDKIEQQLTPCFSDIYLHHWDRDRLFRSRKVAAGQFFISRLPANGRIRAVPSPSSVQARPCVLSEVLSICCGSLNYDGAWDFINYTLTPEAQKVLSRSMMPALRGLRPAWLEESLFPAFELAASRAVSRPEDYFFTLQARLTLQSGLDMWFRHGGELRSMLKDLERSCQQCADFTLRRLRR